ncbi:transcription termination/antitermination protein NusG [Tautonia rosea]|uniref:transcription termination/antitermination protein NusG n=1 Tax=Tautonia rosea TaxID=2728037 RepID=UPI001473D39C|nr:transcription termination/antitermination protein NusG [Tautonia rosea]
MSTTPDEYDEPPLEPESGPPSEPTEPESGSVVGPSNLFEVEESAPDGGPPAGKTSGLHESSDEAETAAEHSADDTDDDQSVSVPVDDEDDEPPPELVWYVLKVQSGREDTIRDALERRVKIQDLGRFFGQIVVPKEKVTEIRNNKKRTVERKSYPGYIMVHMELNEKTWFVVRETPGVGDFVGAHGTPTPMSQAEIDKILKPEEPGETKAVPKIDLERGDRVKIKEGSFENFEGTVEEVIEARGLVKVMIIIFNRPTPVDLEYWQVERV